MIKFELTKEQHTILKNVLIDKLDDLYESIQYHIHHNNLDVAENLEFYYSEIESIVDILKMR